MNISNETQNDETITAIQEKDGDTYEDENSKSPLIPDSKIEENKKYMQEFLEKVKKNGITSNDITELFLKIKESHIEIKELTEDQVKSLIDACELDGISGEISIGNGNGETKREKVELLSTTIPNPSIRRNLIEGGFCGEIVENQLTISDIEKKIESIFSEMIHRIINEGKYIKEVNNSIERYGGYFVHMLNKFATEIEKIAEKEGINITEEKIDSNKLNGYYEYSENTIKDSIDKNINETGNTLDLEGNTIPEGVGEVAEQIKEKFIKSNEGEKYFKISNIYSQLNKKRQSVMKNLDITIRITILKIHLYLEKIEHRYNNTEHTNHALQNLMHRFNETLYFFYERKDIPYRVPREEYGEIGEMGKGTFKEYGRTMFKGLKMDEINGTEIDKKINESRHKLTDKLFECMFDQCLDNPLQFNSHGFDHSILVDGYIQTIIDKDIIKTVRDKYIVSEDEKLVDESTDKIIDNLANFIVRFTAICHDFGYPVSSGYDKCTHGPMGGKLFLDKISLPLKNFLTNVFRKCNLNDSQKKIIKIIHDMYESIYYHSADKKGENYQIKIEGIKPQDEDVINNERERWGSLLLKGNASASPTQIEQFLKFNSYIISFCDIKNEYPDGEYMGIYNGEERKIVVIDGKYNLIKKGGTEIETEKTWKEEEKSIGINAISERISDGKQQAIKLGISLSKNWGNLKIRVKDGNNKIKEFILHDAEINYEEIKDGTEIEISGGNNNKIIIMQDNNKSIYNGRTLDKKGRYGTFGLEYQSRELDEDPVFSAVRLADNLDMSFNRLTPVQTNPALLNLLYNIIPGIGTGLGELYGLLNDYNNEKDGTKKDKILDKIKTYGIVKYDNEKNEISINTDLYIYDTKCGEVKYEKEKKRKREENKVQKIKMKKTLKIGEKFDLVDLKKYIYNLMYYHGECNPAIKEISESVTECDTFGQEEIKHMLGLTPIQDIVFDNEKNCIEVKVDENIFNNELFKKIIKEKSKGTYLEIPLREYHMWRLVAAIKAIPYKGTLPSITIVTGKNKKQIGTINPIEFPFKVIYSTEDKKSVDGNSN